MPPTGSAEAPPEHYLAVLKAAYDYEPQSDDEIAIKEDQILLLVARIDEDWWKVKVKGETQEDDEGPLGLVPAAYVEQAAHTSLVKVLYDYDAAAPGELSVKEDETLLLFETEGDWILAQSHTGDGAGYVPGNYVETTSEDEPAPQPSFIPIVVPESPPPRTSGTYEDPAVRVQAHKLSADDIKTWSVSEIDKKGKKKKGTLGIGNGSLFFASESDKAAVQKWQTSDVRDAFIDKPKHIRIEIDGANAAGLHFHAGSKEGAEEILSKVQLSKEIATSTSSSNDSEAPTEEPTARRLPPMAESSAKSMKKPSVHFSTSEPVIIPPRPQADEGTDDEEETHDVKGENGVALYEFKADGEDELSVAEGEQLLVLERDDDDWWKCRNSTGAEGVVPAQYVQLQTAGSNGAASSSRAQDNEARAKAERLAQEQAEREEAELAEEERKREEERRRKKLEADKAKAAAVAAEAERQKKAQAKAATPKSPTRSESDGAASVSSSKASSELTRPPPDKTRTWHDRSGQFRVDAAFLGFNGGKLRLHKVNGVVVEVPAEKMSLEDMKYVERFMARKGQDLGEDVPLAIAARVNAASSASNSSQNRVPPPPKKGPKIDWFDFFLSAGCDMDDCTRYAAAFERDKIDDTILPDVTDSTMRSLGLKEGDIIRVKKAIEKRKPTENLVKPSPYLQEQIKRDEELAKQLQAQEISSRGGPAPNLFAGPQGALKNPRRGRPQPNKSLPLSNVDIKAIDSASEAIQRTSSPQASTPLSAQPTSNAINPPPRSSSALAATSSGFDDNAWTPRPSSTKPLVGTPPPQNRAPSAPPAAAPATAPSPPAPAPAPTIVATAPAPPPPAAAQSTTPSLAKTTDSDIFEQLARLSSLRAASAPVPSPQPQMAPALSASPSIQTPPSFHVGMGMSNSPLGLGQLQAHTPTLAPTPPQPYNGPRGPFAPVPANQGLLQPLIPTQTGFNSFVPTRASAIQNPPPLPMQTGMMQPLMGGLSPPQLSPVGLLPQQTGIPMNGGFNGGGFGVGQMQFQNHPGFGQMQPLQPQMTSFNPAGNNMFNGMVSAPPIPAAPVKDNSPANIFASMKSGTFEDDNQNNSGPRPPDMYDALRPNPSPLQMQPTGWGQPAYGMGFQR